MKVLWLALLSFSILTGCGSSSDDIEQEGSITPPLPFSQVANELLPLREVSISDHLIFARDVPSDQKETLLNDLRVVESWDGLMGEEQRNRLENLLGVGVGTPSELSFWFKSRIKYIIGANTSNYTIGLVYGNEGRVGLQEFASSDSKEDAEFTGGVNIGSALYLTMIEEKRTRPQLSYIIILINDQWVSALSPRVGIMGIGQALFNSEFPVNKTNPRAISNSIKRLAVLYHEARHSDGNSAQGSVGFPHVECPNSRLIPSEFVGIPACDDSSNGAYSVGAAIVDPLVSYCSRNRRCTDVEISVLNAMRADYLSRVIRSETTVKSLDPSPETGFNALNISDFGAFNLR